MTVLESVLGVVLVLVGGVAAYEYFMGQKTQSPSQSPTPTPTPTPTPDPVWDPLAWLLPSSEPDLMTQWEANASNADVGGISENWSWNSLDDVNFIEQWGSSIFTSTGLRW